MAKKWILTDSEMEKNKLFIPSSVLRQFSKKR